MQGSCVCKSADALTVVQCQFAKHMPAGKGRVHKYKGYIRKAALKSSTAGSGSGSGISSGAITVVQSAAGGGAGKS